MLRRVIAVLAFFGTWFAIWMLTLLMPLVGRTWIATIVALAAAV